MKNLGKLELRKTAVGLVIAVGAAFLAFLATEASAKTGVIVKGENGTKWCCVDGVKDDTCVKGASSIPTGKRCNFASSEKPGNPVGGIIVKGGKNPGGNQ
jgi:hypothetical protein